MSREWIFTRRFHPSDEAGVLVKELGQAFRQELLELIEQLDIKPSDDEESDDG
jgi:hypothetical protein